MFCCSIIGISVSFFLADHKLQTWLWPIHNKAASDTLNSTCMPLDRCQHEVEVKCVSKSRPRCQMTWHASASIPAVLKDDVNGILNAIKKSNLKTSRWPHNFAWSFPQRSLQVSFVPLLVIPPFQLFLHGMWWKSYIKVCKQTPYLWGPILRLTDQEPQTNHATIFSTAS